MLFTVIALATTLAAICIRSGSRELRIFRKDRRAARNLKRQIAITYGPEYVDLAHGKHRMESHRAAHRNCKWDGVCAYKNPDLDGVKATELIAIGRADPGYRSGVTAGLTTRRKAPNWSQWSA